MQRLLFLLELAALRAARFTSVSKGSKGFKVTKDFTQMALSVQKHLGMANIMILNNHTSLERLSREKNFHQGILTPPNSLGQMLNFGTSN